MTNKSISEYRSNFNRVGDISKLMTHLGAFEKTKFDLLFVEGETIYDKMTIYEANYQHVMYDMFSKTLVFGNNVKVNLKDILKLERYVNTDEIRFTIAYRELNKVKKVIFYKKDGM